MSLTGNEYLDIVKNTPLVAIDLIIRDREGRVLLGKRTNYPAKGYWFVPGGRIMKDERLEHAFDRILFRETGIRKKITDATLKGVYQHLYDTNFFEVHGISTHYVVIAYELHLGVLPQIISDSQHSEMKWFTLDELRQDPEVHENARDYFKS